MRATRLVFERQYSDGSGVEFSVGLLGDQIRLKHIDDCDFPVEEIGWLMECLERIKLEVELAATTKE